MVKSGCLNGRIFLKGLTFNNVHLYVHVCFKIYLNYLCNQRFFFKLITEKEIAIPVEKRNQKPGYSAGFSSTYTKIGTIQRRLVWPPHKYDMQIREAIHIFIPMADSC